VTGGSGGAGGSSAAAGAGGAGLAGSGGTVAGGGAGAGGAGALSGAGAGGAAGAAMSGAGGSGAGTAGKGGSGGVPTFDRTPEGTCARWNADRAETGEGTWSGSVDSCSAGDISADGRANALRLFNLYRWLADLPEVTTSPERDQMAQECALMQEANNSLSHEPPDTWECYTEVGAEGSATSNISSGPGVSSVDAYMLDFGNESTHGHRRIILSNWLGPIGLGSTGPGGASCMQNIGGDGDAGKEWVAWPPPGPFPMQAYERNRGRYSDTGWSVQSEDIDVRTATVTVTTSGGMSMPVMAEALTGNYGSTRGLSFVPDGWEPMAGETYTVTLGGISQPITYAVQMVDCEM
jgi:hypothetical protein